MKFLATSQKLALQRRAKINCDSVQSARILSDIEEKYWEWASEDIYLILHRLENNVVVLNQNNKGTYEPFKAPKEKIQYDSKKKMDGKFKIAEPKFFECFKSDVFAIKCAKRGNDVHRRRVYNRFKGLSKAVDKTRFFNPKDRGEQKTTRALFATFTYDTKLCSFGDAWENIGKEFNRAMAYIRKNFGEVSTCRVFEAYENGHPHIHCILLFKEKEFKVFRDEKGQFRIREKNIFAKGWHSFVDVKAMYSLGYGFSYLKKYLLKSIDKDQKDSKALKTLALGWLFNKRSFSVSGKFKKLLADLIKTKHNSNHKTQQINFEGKIVKECVYFCLGFVSRDIISLKNNVRFCKLDYEQIKTVQEFLETVNRKN